MDSTKQKKISTAIDCFYLLQNQKDIDLRKFPHHLSLIENVNNDSLLKAQLFREMSQQKLLSPVPEIFWRVDRNLQEYRERTGIDLLNLINSMQERCNSGDVILELGSGCGYAASEKRSDDAIKSFFSLFSINNIIHFPVRSLIGEILELDVEYKNRHGSNQGYKTKRYWRLEMIWRNTRYLGRNNCPETRVEENDSKLINRC